MRERSEVGRAQITAFILAVLALQLVPVAREFTGARETLWPFLAWGMYRHSSTPPVETTAHRILARTDAGRRRVRARDAGFDRFAFRRFYQIPIAAGDSAAARDLAGRLVRRWETPVREILLEERIVTLAEDGSHERKAIRGFAAGPR
ncbi:MAG TPA: hypothetical protein VFH11_14325 [Gemmatimonadota bacterium]|nr:hypothetical protein [Gemmatimonadota bacterium]